MEKYILALSVCFKYKIAVLLFALLSVCHMLSAQTDSLWTQVDSCSLQTDTLIETHEPVLGHKFEMYSPSDSINPLNRISALQINNVRVSSNRFWFFMVMSIASILLFLATRSLFFQVLKSIFNFQFSLQLNRGDRPGIVYSYAMYLLLGLIYVSYILASNTNFFSKKSIAYNLVFIALFFLVDFAFSYLYKLFSKSNRIVDFTHSVSLSYAVPFLLIAFILMPFIYFGKPMVQQFSYAIFIGLLLVIFAFKELRVLRTAQSEKVKVFSFYFFAYLCTFKILPLIIVLKLII